MKSCIPNIKIVSSLSAFGLGFVGVGTTQAQAQTQIGIGSGHPGADVDGGVSRMIIENTAGTFPNLPAGIYDVTNFQFSASADTSDIQPFLAVNPGGDNYSVI